MNPDPVPAWLQIAEAVGQALGTIAVIVALAALFWQLRKDRDDRRARDEQAREDRSRYDDQMAALQRAEDDRISAQARKVVPSVNRAEMFGQDIFIARVLNTSTGAITGLCVVVAEFDTEGNRVRDCALQANNQVDVAGGIERVFGDAVNGAFAGVFGSGSPIDQMMRLSGAGQPGLGGQTNPITNQLTRAMQQRIGPEVMDQVRDAMIGQLTTEWPTTLGPNQPAIMAFRTTVPNSQLRIAIEYEDEAGYRWQRRGDDQPMRVRDLDHSTDS